MRKTSIILAGLITLASQSGIANTITSNMADCNAGAAPGARVFSVTANSVTKCLLAGVGNINGSSQEDAAFVTSGWQFIDSTDGNGGAHNNWLGVVAQSGGLSGSFTINALAYGAYEKIAIGFKSGNGQLDPDWAIFQLGDNAPSGTWTISRNALSHAILYGFGTTSIPEPGTVLLLGMGLLGLGLARRKLQK